MTAHEWKRAIFPRNITPSRPPRRQNEGEPSHGCGAAHRRQSRRCPPGQTLPRGKASTSVESPWQHAVAAVADLALRDSAGSGDFMRPECTGLLLAEGRFAGCDPFPGVGVPGKASGGTARRVRPWKHRRALRGSESGSPRGARTPGTRGPPASAGWNSLKATRLVCAGRSEVPPLRAVPDPLFPFNVL